MGKYSLRSFDPNRVTVTVAGQTMVGFSDEKVTVERANNAWELVIGSDGEGTRIKSNDKSGTITFNLQQTSPSNDFLSALFYVDETSSAGVVPIVIKDNSGTTLITAPLAFIENMPSSTFSKTQNDRTWVFRTNQIEFYLGGNDAALVESSGQALGDIRDAYNKANPNNPLKWPPSNT